MSLNSLTSFVSTAAGRCRGWLRRAPQVSVVRLSGVIGLGGPFRGGLTVQGVGPLLEQAFAPKRLAAVALVINSPGGSPVQSALIARRIRALAEERSVPVLAFVEDVAASGGYWLACAADEIFANESSIVGSIGVISAGFGFQDLIGRLGIERRVHTAGERKLLLDPFQPEKPEETARLKALQAEIHESFKEMVRSRRQHRLKTDGDDGEAVLFSGEFWTGRSGLALGLVDGIDDLHSRLRSRFGPRVRLRPVSVRQGWVQRRLTGSRVADAAGASGAGDWAATLAGGALDAVEERCWWARYGL